MSILNPSASVLVWDAGIEVSSVQYLGGSVCNSSKSSSYNPSMSLLLASCNQVSSILCSDRVTQYGQQLYQHCSALTLLDIHLICRLMMTGCLLVGILWGQKGKGRKKYSVFSHSVKPRTLPQHTLSEQDTGHDTPIENSKGQITR